MGSVPTGGDGRAAFGLARAIRRSCVARRTDGTDPLPHSAPIASPARPGTSGAMRRCERS